MTEQVFHLDPYLRSLQASVVAHTPEGGIILDRSLFYPTGGGQPGDSGWLDWAGKKVPVATTLKAEGGTIALVVGDAVSLPPVGALVTQHLDWERRHLHMRVHTALHLLSVVVPLPVTGGQIGPGKGRLDFDMPDAPADVTAIETALNDLISRDLAVSELWITDAELAANPGLVKTMSVKPPMGQGRVRLIRIGEEKGEQIDLQPCGGTHVARTGEIGMAYLGKIEKKGRVNRRISISLDAG